MCLEVFAEEHFRSECAEDCFELFNRTSRKIEGIQKDPTAVGLIITLFYSSLTGTYLFLQDKGLASESKES